MVVPLLLTGCRVGFRECWTDRDCAPELTCTAGGVCAAAPGCDACAAMGARSCVSGTSYRTCGDDDGDGCLTWSDETACPAGFSCGSGNCEYQVSFVDDGFTVVDADGNTVCSAGVGTEDDPYNRTNTFVVVDAQVADVDGDGQPEVVVIARHQPYYPGQVSVFDLSGQLQGRYWNPGHIRSMYLFDITGDARLDIVVGACNNDQQPGLWIPTIFALDGQRVFGEGPPNLGTFPAGSELWYTFVDLGSGNAVISALAISPDLIRGNTESDGSGTDYCVDFYGTPVGCP
ncbi:MAG: VCBS repeat-containing protein [Deltaproteobacteria bacterium]|nr:VCBS repeat-containing protein [Deltaproteobacteria bacterium]